MDYESYWEVDPDLTEEHLRMWLEACRYALRYSESASDAYECEYGGPKCHLAYLPPEDMVRPYTDDVIPRTYPNGAVICLAHSTMWPYDPKEPLPKGTPHVWAEMRKLGEIEPNTKLDELLGAAGD